jgi:hypothetical protein
VFSQALPAGSDMSWFPDSRAILVCGKRPEEPSHCYRLALDGSAAVRLRPEEMRDGYVSPDGRSLLARDKNGDFVLWPLDGGPPRPVPGLLDDEDVVAWTSDGRGIFMRGTGLPRPVTRVDLASGARRPVLSLVPEVAAGVVSVNRIHVSQDGRAYAYGYVRQVGTVYAVKWAGVERRQSEEK